MSESEFKSIIDEYVNREFNSYPDATDHIFSRKHRSEMKKIFKIYKRNAAVLRQEAHAETGILLSPEPKRKFNPFKQAFIILIVVFLALLSGCYLKPSVIFTDFTGRAYSDHTEIRLKNKNNGPETIEKKYVLTDIPEGFEIKDKKEDEFGVRTRYINRETDGSIWFEQMIKKTYGPVNLNTDHGKLVEIDINGHKGLMIEEILEENHFTNILWDDGEYLLIFSCSFDKNTALNLAKSAKLSEI